MNGDHFSSALARLHDVIESLEHAWADTCNSWNDATRDELEVRHLLPILQQLNGVVEATVPVRECFAQARRACGDGEQRD
jgi:hypothetical protein